MKKLVTQIEKRDQDRSERARCVGVGQLGLRAWGLSRQQGQDSSTWVNDVGQGSLVGEEWRKKEKKWKGEGWWISDGAMVSFNGGGERMMNWRQRWEFDLRKGMNETGRGKKEIKKRKVRNNILMWGGNKKSFLSLALSYSAQPYMVVQCSWVRKNFTYTTSNVAPFSYMVVLKIVI